MATKKKTNFAEEVPSELVNPEATTETQALTAPPSSTALVNPNAVDDLDVGDVPPPYMQLVHGVGEAAELFNPGDLILAKEHLICPKGQKIETIILNISQYYKERVSNDAWMAGERPRIFKTLEEAEDVGLRTAWENNIGPDVSRAMNLTLMLRKPEGMNSGMFGIDIGDGHSYALAMFTSDKTAYQYLIKDIGLIIKTKLKRSGVYSGLWDFYTELSKPNSRGNRTQVVRASFKDMLEETTIHNILEAINAPTVN